VEICSNCNHTFEDTANSSGKNVKPCPNCGSTARTLSISVLENVSVLENATLSATAVLGTVSPFSFGAIVTLERNVLDGQVIKLIDPIYRSLIEAISKDPQIIYHIDARKWEEIIAATYNREGYEVILTPRSGDLGRDVIAIKKGKGTVKFIDQVKAYHPGHLVTADEVRSLLGVLHAEQDASKAILSTTSHFAPRVEEDRFIKPFLPTRLELVDKEKLLEWLITPNP
jgi:restriction system protein